MLGNSNGANVFFYRTQAHYLELRILNLEIYKIQKSTYSDKVIKVITLACSSGIYTRKYGT